MHIIGSNGELKRYMEHTVRTALGASHSACGVAPVQNAPVTCAFRDELAGYKLKRIL